jgi:hypothetical protein
MVLACNKGKKLPHPHFSWMWGTCLEEKEGQMKGRNRVRADW